MVYSTDMAAKDTSPKELAETLSYIVDHMATKDDLAALREEMATKDDLAALRSELKGDIARLSEQVTGIEREVKSIRRDLNDLMEKIDNMSGYREEIDHALERIAAIERHLGLDKKKIAA